jgi:2-oxoglutarate dehydrogenase E2 component (dihydrolipoamide succinyltransferase)
LAEIETDKVVLEIAAPGTGIVGPQLRKKGDTVKRGDVITTIEQLGGAASDKPEAAPAPRPTKAAKRSQPPATALVAKTPPAKSACRPPPAAVRPRFRLAAPKRERRDGRPGTRPCAACWKNTSSARPT